jgi:hypothetical protein
MNKIFGFTLFLFMLLGSGCRNIDTVTFPPEIVDFIPYKNNPVFRGTGTDTWDKEIRERGYILHEGDIYHLWYTGYNHDRGKTYFLGYANSHDGINWTRYSENPIFKESWAVSIDRAVWTNVQDNPVIAMGPEPYDLKGVAVNQIIKYKNRYYAYYHATAFDPWRDWTTNVAMSEDLIHWVKYPNNPIISGDKSSGILVRTGNWYYLYTMHPDVWVYFPKKEK